MRGGPPFGGPGRWALGPHFVAWLGGPGVGPHAVAWRGGPGIVRPCGATGHGGPGSFGPMPSPGTPIGMVPPGAHGPGTVEGSGRSPACSAGSGGAGVSPVRVWSGWPLGWDGGQALIRATNEPPAALMDRPMMGPAHQGQIGQIGGAAIQPVDQMMGLAPGQGALAVREDAAAVADSQSGPLGRADDPGGPAQVQRLAVRPAQDRRQQGGRGAEPRRQPLGPARSTGRGWTSGTGTVVRVVLVAVLAADQHPCDGPSQASRRHTPPGCLGRPRRPHQRPRPRVRRASVLRGGPAAAAAQGPARPGPRPGGPAGPERPASRPRR